MKLSKNQLRKLISEATAGMIAGPGFMPARRLNETMGGAEEALDIAMQRYLESLIDAGVASSPEEVHAAFMNIVDAFVESYAEEWENYGKEY